MAKTTKGKITGEVVAGLAAVGAAAAGYYFYASKHAKEHRKVAAKWATDMKKDVIREARALKQVTAKDFMKVVDTVAETYHNVRTIDPQELKRAAGELKSNWEHVRREIKSGERKTAPRKKTARKTPAKNKAR